MQYVEFKLISSQDERIFLDGNVDIDTIDDDEPEFEYMQNNGTYDTHLPNYWKVDGDDLSDDFEVFVHSIEWERLNQFLWDFRFERDVFDFQGNILIINNGVDKKTTVQVRESTKLKLAHLGSKGDSFDDIITSLLNCYKTHQ